MWGSPSIRQRQVFHPRVLITFFPDRLTAQLATERARPHRQVHGGNAAPPRESAFAARSWTSRGCARSLRTGSLLTGELYVAFEYFPDAPKVKLDWTQEPLELPVVPGSLASIEAKLGSILTKIDRLPLDAIGGDVRTALATLDRRSRMRDTLVNRVDAQWVPEGTKTLEELRRAIADADRVVKNADTTLFSKDSPAPQDLRDMLQEITRAARSVRVLVDYLERHPDTLLRGKPTEKP